MKCLVTGATGFLGTNLVHVLADAGHEVRALGLPGSRTDFIEDRADVVLVDILEPRELEAATAGMEVVFHVAGDTSFWVRRFARQRAVNVDGTANVIAACQRHEVRRLVHTSTVDTLGYDPRGIADETWSDYNYAGWRYNYADTKREGERLAVAARADGLDVVVIHPGSMLGPYDFTLQYGRIFRELAAGKIPAIPSGGSSFGHVAEVARAHLAAAEHDAPQAHYICAGDNVTYRDLFERMAAKVGAGAPRFDLPRPLAVAYGKTMELASRLTGRPPDLDPGMARYMSIRAWYDSSRAQRDLAYRLVPLDDQIEDAHRWLSEHGLLGA